MPRWNKALSDCFITGKKCIRCNSDGPFQSDSTRPDGLHPYCKSCKRKTCKSHYLQNKQKYREYGWKIRYGVSKETYQALFDSQNGVCAVCSGPPTREFLDIDHNHLNGKVRGLLCSPCNMGLGQLKDSASLMRKLADYVERHNESQNPNS